MVNGVELDGNNSNLQWGHNFAFKGGFVFV